MAAINRKQLPLCAEHHKALHNSTLSHDERELFKKNEKMLPGNVFLVITVGFVLLDAK